MLEHKLTGRRRHRVHKQCFRPALLVLQFEVEGLKANWDCGWISCTHQKWWVDAKPEWLLTTKIGEQD